MLNFYGKITGGGKADPVFRNIYILWRSGVHIEASIIYMRGYESEVYEAASKIASISPKIPLQIMRFLPVGDAGLELQPTPREAEELCRRLSYILDYVYLFNTPATSYLNTIVNQTLYCMREFYGLMGCRTIYSNPDSYYKLTGHRPPKSFFEEEGFFGGFRVTRPIEIIVSILNAIGVEEASAVRLVLSKLLNREFISKLHWVVDGVDSRLEDYLTLIEYVGLEANALKKARELVDFIRGILDSISTVKGGCGVKVYYSFGHPLYALAYPRMENKLVEATGCTSVNRVVMEGKPGRTITLGLLEKLNPDIIFISGFMSYPEEYFYKVCRAYGVSIKAVVEKRVYRVPPAWDFGSPKWILGLVYIASKVNPEAYNYDVDRVARDFYRRFYGVEPRMCLHNLSFYKP